jgi:hypothetical protein
MKITGTIRGMNVEMERPEPVLQDGVWYEATEYRKPLEEEWYKREHCRLRQYDVGFDPYWIMHPIPHTQCAPYKGKCAECEDKISPDEFQESVSDILAKRLPATNTMIDKVLKKSLTKGDAYDQLGDKLIDYYEMEQVVSKMIDDIERDELRESEV